ncbi:MAG: glycosyltransferase family 4 protein, partial [Candidatus Bathyarchaeota archaeon]
LHQYPWTSSIYRDCAADIYHSEEPSWGTVIAMRTVRGGRHVATLQNPRSRSDWEKVDRYYPLRRRVFNLLYGGRLKEAVKHMDAVYCQARYQRSEARTIYDLDKLPGFLPNPVDVPKARPLKDERPTVCFLGRFDGEKRPEQFFELARGFPEVDFIALGAAHNDVRDTKLRRNYGGIENLEMPGFKTGREKRGVLERSWILVNTSVSEGFPIAFLEAVAHHCAILSYHDPDCFATNFGFHASEETLDEGLRWLLEGDRWRELGERGYDYVSRVHEREKVIERHLEVYKELMAR